MHDFVSHYIFSDKLKATDINPYVINWILDFLSQRKQRVVVDGITTEFMDINRGIVVIVSRFPVEPVPAGHYWEVNNKGKDGRHYIGDEDLGKVLL